MLGSEYGWTKDYILDSVYPDELFHLNRKIRLRTLGDRMVALMISRDPHGDDDSRRRVSDSMKRELQELTEGGENVGGLEPDHAGIAALKERLASESRFIKVK